MLNGMAIDPRHMLLYEASRALPLANVPDVRLLLDVVYLKFDDE